MKVGIVSPAGMVKDQESLQKGLDYLQDIGLDSTLGEHCFDQWWYMGGTNQNRAKDLMNFYKNPEFKAIISTRGGAGSAHLLELLDYDLIKKNPKPLIGFSDLTALQNAIYAKTGVPSLTGFMAIYHFMGREIGKNTAESLDNFLKNKAFEIKSGETIIEGEAEGTLVGGCLSVFRSLFGTEYMPDIADKIILIEDVAEKPYKIDLMLTQLTQQPKFNKVKGIVFGKFANCVSTDPEDGTIDDVINYFCQNIKIPVIKNFEYGHIPNGYVLPIGKKVKLDASAQRLFITSPDIFQAL